MSYNLHHDNGTKATNSEGYKTEVEAEVKTEVHTDGETDETLSVIKENTGCIADHVVGRNCHTGYPTLSVICLPKDTRAGSDRVNGSVLSAVKSAPDVSGVKIHATNNELNGANTNINRGLIYTEAS